MPANRQGNGNFFDYGGFSNVNLFTNATGTQTYADKVKTTSESQATPAADPTPTSSGTGAGTSSDPYKSVGPDDNPRVTATNSQYAVNTSAAALNQLITTQPNQLDQFASYTYNIAWYLLSETQYTAMVDSQKADTTGWQLLMQSGGAPIKGRSPAFPVDYYMDDLEIETKFPGGGTNRANTATNIRFKVTEPNGITLLQSIFNAVVGVYKNDTQSQTNTNNNGTSTAKSAGNTGTPNYLAAQYCLVIEFFGYDQNGKLSAPVKGTFSAGGGYGQSNVIVKYYPFRLTDIKFQVANRAVEYTIIGKPIGQSYGFTTDRGTIPFPFTMTGQTVEQLLNGSPVASGKTSAGTGTSTADPGARTTTPTPPTQTTPTAASANEYAVNDKGEGIY